MEEKKELMTVENISNRVYLIRGQQVMLDCDLAEIYGYEVKRLNEQVKRNSARFPEDFMFQLTKEEVPEECLKSQFATLNENRNKRGLHIKKLPYAFTEQGIYMLATVLRGELAEQQRTECDVQSIQKSIDTLAENFVSDKDVKNFVIYKGQKFEADLAYIDIYQQATASIYVVDDYVNAKTLQLLSQKKPGVEVILFTENGHGQKGFLTPAVIKDFAAQYPSLRIKPNPDCHDRWIVLDYGLASERVYHCGASSKDAGRKVCAINKVENVGLVHPVVEELLVGEDNFAAANLK